VFFRTHCISSYGFHKVQWNKHAVCWKQAASNPQHYIVTIAVEKFHVSHI